MAFAIETIYDHPVPTYHHKTYPSIDATQSSLSASGKTVLITGGGTGISRGIVESYAKAGVSNLILVSLRIGPLEQAKTELEKDYSKTKVFIYSGSTADTKFVSKVFNEVRATIGDIDILILNATIYKTEPVLTISKSLFESVLDVNVHGNLDLVQNFLAVPSSIAKPKIIIDISSGAAHWIRPGSSTYGTTKAMWSTMLMTLLKEVEADGSQPGLRIHTFHPGVVLTEKVLQNGMTEDMIETWDDRSLPSDYSVWLASPQAAWLSGKFTWSSWDVDELKEIKDKILGSSTMLVFGLPNV